MLPSIQEVGTSLQESQPPWLSRLVMGFITLEERFCASRRVFSETSCKWAVGSRATLGWAQARPPRQRRGSLRRRAANPVWQGLETRTGGHTQPLRERSGLGVGVDSGQDRRHDAGGWKTDRDPGGVASSTPSRQEARKARRKRFSRRRDTRLGLRGDRHFIGSTITRGQAHDRVARFGLIQRFPGAQAHFAPGINARDPPL